MSEKSDYTMVEVKHMTEQRAVRKEENWWTEESGLIYDAVVSGARLATMEPGKRFKVQVEGISRDLLEKATEAGFEDYEAAFRSLNPNYEPESMVN